MPSKIKVKYRRQAPGYYEAVYDDLDIYIWKHDSHRYPQQPSLVTNSYWLGEIRSGAMVMFEVDRETKHEVVEAIAAKLELEFKSDDTSSTR